MKNIFLLVVMCSSFSIIFAQRITKIHITGQGVTESIAVTTDDNVLINLSADGNVISYGVEYFSEKIPNYSRLEKYDGRIDLYATTDDKLLVGKLKYVGRTAITYYASYDLETLRGKIKSIGNMVIDYYMEYDDASIKGKIKSIGNNQLVYFTSFDNTALIGKLKSLGSTNLNYYSSFEDKAFAGKIKTIGQVNFSYYPSYDRQYAGSMKTGSQMQNIAGVNYFIQ